MYRNIKRMLKEAKANEEFNREAKEADPKGYMKPNFWSESIEEHLYVSVYYGWLVAKGRFNKKNYE